MHDMVWYSGDHAEKIHIRMADIGFVFVQLGQPQQMGLDLFVQRVGFGCAVGYRFVVDFGGLWGELRHGFIVYDDHLVVINCVGFLSQLWRCCWRASWS